MLTEHPNVVAFVFEFKNKVVDAYLFFDVVLEGNLLLFDHPINARDVLMVHQLLVEWLICLVLVKNFFNHQAANFNDASFHIQLHKALQNLAAVNLSIICIFKN